MGLLASTFFRSHSDIVSKPPIVFLSTGPELPHLCALDEPILIKSFLLKSKGAAYRSDLEELFSLIEVDGLIVCQLDVEVY